MTSLIFKMNKTPPNPLPNRPSNPKETALSILPGFTKITKTPQKENQPSRALIPKGIEGCSGINQVTARSMARRKMIPSKGDHSSDVLESQVKVNPLDNSEGAFHARVQRNRKPFALTRSQDFSKRAKFSSFLQVNKKNQN